MAARRNLRVSRSYRILWMLAAMCALALLRKCL